MPAKSETESKRREARNKAKQRATELLKLGKADEARTYLKQSINITPEMASSVIKECHKLGVDCIVAPYESDAQLAFFNRKGKVPNFLFGPPILQTKCNCSNKAKIPISKQPQLFLLEL